MTKIYSVVVERCHLLDDMAAVFYLDVNYEISTSE